MNRLIALAAAFGALAATGAAPAPPAFDVKIEARAMHEECARLEAGETRRYHWKADAPVDFNIHFHQGDAVSYPVKRDGMRGDGGAFTAKSAQDYCWMWTARDKPARLEGRVGY